MKNKIKPVFNKKCPKNALRYLSIESDYEFQSKHPIGYKVLQFIGITALLLPLVLYLLFIIAIFPAPNSSFIFLGLAGAFVFGIGLFNIVAAWINQYLGHTVTIVCLLLGSSLLIITCIFLYS